MLKNAAFKIGWKSTNPKHIALMYPTIIPIKNGIIFRNPFPLTIINAVVKNVIKATITPFHSNCVSDERPIWLIAFGAKPRPIIIIIGPITTGGKSLWIHSLPISLMMIENITYIIPTIIIPVIAPATPPLA